MRGGWPIGGSGLSSRAGFSKNSSSCVAPDPSPRRQPILVLPVYAGDLGLTSCARAAPALRQGAGSGAEKWGKAEEDRLRSINKINAATVKIRGWWAVAFTLRSGILTKNAHF